MTDQDIQADELREALRKDFHALLVKEFTVDWKIQRMVHDLEIDVMSFENATALIAKAVEQARIDSVQLYMDTCEENGVEPSWVTLHEFQDGQRQAQADLQAQRQQLGDKS